MPSKIPHPCLPYYLISKILTYGDMRLHGVFPKNTPSWIVEQYWCDLVKRDYPEEIRGVTEKELVAMDMEVVYRAADQENYKKLQKNEAIFFRYVKVDDIESIKKMIEGYLDKRGIVHLAIIEFSWTLLQKQDKYLRDLIFVISFHHAQKVLDYFYLKILSLLGSHNIDPVFGRSRLHWAAACNQIEQVKELLNNAEINIDAVDKFDATALFLAAKNGHSEVVNLLLSKNANVNYKRPTDQVTPLYVASEYGHFSVVNILVAHKATIDCIRSSDNTTPLFMAAQNGHEKVVRLLGSNGANIHITTIPHRITPLYVAAQNGHPFIVQFLIDKGGDVNWVCPFDGTTPLCMAAERGHLLVSKFLIAKGANVNFIGLKKGGTPLFFAVQNGHAQIVEYLIQAGADVNYVSPDGSTAAFRGAKNEHEAVVRSLILHGANVNLARSSDGMTPLAFAIKKENVTLCKLLICAGANFRNSPKENSFDPLFLGLKSKNLEIKKLFKCLKKIENPNQFLQKIHTIFKTQKTARLTEFFQKESAFSQSYDNLKENQPVRVNAQQKAYLIHTIYRKNKISQKEQKAIEELLRFSGHFRSFPPLEIASKEELAITPHFH